MFHGLKPNDERPEVLYVIKIIDGCPTHPSGISIRFSNRYRNPRRYYTNESIILNSDGAEASMYWQLFQERSGESIVGWGTYRWEFCRERTKWLITRQAVHILVMTRLDIGWATPDNVMPL